MAINVAPLEEGLVDEGAGAAIPLAIVSAIIGPRRKPHQYKETIMGNSNISDTKGSMAEDAGIEDTETFVEKAVDKTVQVGGAVVDVAKAINKFRTRNN